MKNKKAIQTPSFNLLRGVVEDNKDPLKIGRVRVRIFGLHPDKNENSGAKFEFAKTSDLPWAEVMGSTEFGLVGGIGISSVLHQGTWVWLMLENNDPNKPVVLGTVHGINSGPSTGKADSGAGFFDPDGRFPPPDNAYRTDMNGRLDYAYTTAHAIETQSGHKIVLEDTGGDENILVMHRKGSHFLIDHTGDIFVFGVRHAEYKVIGNMTWRVGGNTTWKIDGNMTYEVKGNATWKVQGNTTHEVGGSTTWKVGGNFKVNAARIDLN